MLCKKCYAKRRYKERKQSKNKIIKCEICNTEGEKDKDIFYNSKVDKLLCVKHYNQIRRHGKIVRTVNDSNKIIKYDNYAEVVLYNRKGEKVDTTKIDKEDIDKIKEYKWHLDQYNHYVIGSYKGKQKRLHRYVMNPPNNKLIDHINNNRTDNRKKNLRVVNAWQNTLNSKIPSDNTSGVKGVYWCNTKEKWKASIQVKGKNFSLGYYNNLDDAKKKRKEAEKKYFGKYRYDYNPNKE